MLRDCRASIRYDAAGATEDKAESEHTSISNNHLRGELGEFCERVQNGTARAADGHFKASDTGDGPFAYLQVALEVPYWELIAGTFIQCCGYADDDRASIQAVLMTLQCSSIALTMRLDSFTQADHDDIPQEIANRIKARVDVLKSLTERASWVCEDFDDLDASSIRLVAERAVHSTIVAVDIGDRADVRIAAQHELEKVASSTVLLSFLTTTVIPTCIGFAKSYGTKPADNAVGSSLDASFWWLISGTMLAVLGNIFSVFPLFKFTRNSVAYQVAWALIVVSCALGVAAVATYPFFNKAWSSLLTTLSACFGNAAVYISTQHISNQAERAGSNPTLLQRATTPTDGSSESRSTAAGADQSSASRSTAVAVRESTQVQHRHGRSSAAASQR